MRACQSASNRIFSALLCLVVSFGFLNPATAQSGLSARDLIEHGKRPDGVVFEIIEGKEADLGWALEQIKEDIDALRRHFPQLPVAVVSHGREEFALTTANEQEFSSIHSLGKALVEDDVPIHICATHASWYDITPEDFPRFVDVAPTGPGQIAQYEEMGYQLIVVEKR